MNQKLRRPRGRPAQADLTRRNKELLEVATALFLDHGFQGVSVDLIACEAQVSTKTIYHRFGGKAGLFSAVIHQLSDRVLAPFSTLAMSTASPREVLTGFAQKLLEVLLTPDSVALERIILAEAVRFPDLARAFYENGPTRVLSLLANYLQEKTKAGVMSVSDPEIAAEQFVQMIISEPQRRALLGIEPMHSSAESAKRIDLSVDLFLGFVQYGQGASNCNSAIAR